MSYLEEESDTAPLHRIDGVFEGQCGNCDAENTECEDPIFFDPLVAPVYRSPGFVDSTGVHHHGKCYNKNTIQGMVNSSQILRDPFTRQALAHPDFHQQPAEVPRRFRASQILDLQRAGMSSEAVDLYHRTILDLQRAGMSSEAADLYHRTAAEAPRRFRDIGTAARWHVTRGG